MKYRIVHLQYFNDKAVVTTELWQVDEWRQGIFGSRWKALKSTSCGPHGPHRWATSFDSEDDARATIKRLIDGASRDDWTRTIVEVSDRQGQRSE